jgi:hypothetical protein
MREDISTKIESKIAEDMRIFCIIHKIKIMDFIEAAIKEKLAREVN